MAGSLPTRERELKHVREAVLAMEVKSLPTRERELKHFDRVFHSKTVESLPTRERELKPVTAHVFICINRRSLCGSVS